MIKGIKSPQLFLKQLFSEILNYLVTSLRTVILSALTTKSHTHFNLVFLNYSSVFWEQYGPQLVREILIWLEVESQ